jgi:hypothetical protein
MKKILTGSLMLLVSLFISARGNEMIMSDVEDPEKIVLKESFSGNEYDSRIDSINQQYLESIEVSEKAFSESLPGGFKVYKVMPVIKAPEYPEPAKIKRYRKTHREDIQTHLIERKISFIAYDRVFYQTGFDKPKSEVPIKAIQFQYLDSSFSIDLDKQIYRLPGIGQINPVAIKECYDFLQKTDYQISLERLAGICTDMNFNDWDYYCLINEVTRSISEDIKLQKVIAWFMLLESGYKVKIGYFNDSVEVLFASDQNIFGRPWYNINGERYYSSDNDYSTIYTYSTEYFKGYRYLNLFHDKPLLIGGHEKERVITFPYGGISYSIPVKYDQHYAEYYKKFPEIPIDFYFATPASTIFRESIETVIAPYLQKKSTIESLKFLLSLVQYGFGKKADAVQSEHGRNMIPDEILLNGYADSGGRTTFFLCLVSELLRKDVIVLDINGYMCAAVESDDPWLKGNLIYRQKEYIVCDPSYPGAPPGAVMPPYKIKDGVIIDFNTHLNHYSLEKKIWNSLSSKGLIKTENSNNLYIEQDGSAVLTGMIINNSFILPDEGKSFDHNPGTFIAGLDQENEIKWFKKVTGSGPNISYCLSGYNDQIIYVLGYFENSLKIDHYELSEDEDGSFFIAKIARSGEIFWLKMIGIPYNSFNKRLHFILDDDGKLKYYKLDENPYKKSDNNIVNGGNGYLYVDALVPDKRIRLLVNRSYSENFNVDNFDLVKYLTIKNENLLKNNYPESVSLILTIFQYLVDKGNVIEGSSLQKVVTHVYKDAVAGYATKFSEVNKISEIGNYEGITSIKTINQQPVVFNHWRAQNESRLKLSFINGDAKIDVLHGIKYKVDQIWNDVNYILLDKSTGEIKIDYENHYQKKMPVPSQLL